MIQFISKGGSVATQQDRQLSSYVLLGLCDRFNPYTLINMLYNNQKHSNASRSDRSFDVCSYSDLCNISMYSHSPDHVVYVEGVIHDFNHSSGILFHPETNKNLFVQDFYIRVKINSLDAPPIHILVASPVINTSDKTLLSPDSPVIISPSEECESGITLIGPNIQPF